MTSALKWIVGIGVILTITIGGYYFGRYHSFKQVKKSETATVLIEKMTKVSKLVTTEAYISEIYNYKEYYYYDISPFRKKVLLRVNAKVSAGFNFDHIKLSIDHESKTITLDSIPDPEIMSIDHDLDYYDLQEGTFNAFSEEELTEIQRRAKKFIEDKAIESKLFEEAEEHKKEYLETLQLIAETLGWQLDIKKKHHLD